MKSKRFLAIAILTFVALVSVFALVACEEDVPHECESVCPICGKCLNPTCQEDACLDKCPGHELPDYNMSNVAFVGKTVTYNGTAQTLEVVGTLPSGVTVTYEYYNGETKLESAPVNAGSYKVIAKFSGDDEHKAIPDREATLTIEKATYDMSGVSFNNDNLLYTGEPLTLTLTGAVPQGVTVTYTHYSGEEPSEATKLEGAPVAIGTYTVVASFTVDSNHNDIADLKATLVIEKSNLDEFGIALRGATVTYDGQVHSLAISGTLPEGVTVAYEYYLGETKLEGAPKNAGTYTVWAKFTSTNAGVTVADKEATLIIQKATYDISEITFEGDTVTYNGQAHTLAISGQLPEGVTVSYEYYFGMSKLSAAPVDAGSYWVSAVFAGDAANYNAIQSKTATLTIEKATIDMSGITFEGATVQRDGSPKSLAISGTLPTGITGVSYEYKLGDTVQPNAPTAAGRYTVTAKFAVDGNYNAVEPMTAILIIADFALIDDSVVYDGQPHTLAITGNLPEGVHVEYEYYLGQTKLTSDPVDAGVYTVVAKFSGGSLEDQTATLTINKADIKVILGANRYVNDLNETKVLDQAVEFVQGEQGVFTHVYTGVDYTIDLVGVITNFGGTLTADNFVLYYRSNSDGTGAASPLIPDVDRTVYVQVMLDKNAPNYDEITKNYNATCITSLTVTKRIVHITNATELQNMINDLDNKPKLQLSSKYVLDNDIDLQNAVWRTIGASLDAASFIGEFDGQGHVIKNFLINKDSVTAADITHTAGTAFGFWGYITDAYIHDVKFENIKVNIDVDELKAKAPGYVFTSSAANPIVFGIVAGRTRNSFWNMGTIFENITVTNLDAQILSYGGFYGTFVGEEYAGVGTALLPGDPNYRPGTTEAANIRNNLDATNVKIFAAKRQMDKFGRLSIGGIVGELMYSGHIYENCDLTNVHLINGMSQTHSLTFVDDRWGHTEQKGFHVGNVGGFIGLDYSTWIVSQFNNCTLTNYRLENWINNPGYGGTGVYYGGSMRGNGQNVNATGTGVDINDCTATNPDDGFYGLFRYLYQDDGDNCVQQNGHWAQYVFDAETAMWRQYKLSVADFDSSSSTWFDVTQYTWNIQNVAYDDDEWEKYVYNPETGAWNKQ